ncbi:MAG: peptidase domain-containing ABC transporter [Pseudomonadota bacterium]
MNAPIPRDGLTPVAKPRLKAKPTDQLHLALQTGRFGDFEATSSFASCLMPFLNAHGWRGTMREVAEALPHFANDLGLDELRNTLANLGVETRALSLTLDHVDNRLLPCIAVNQAEKDEDPEKVVVLVRQEGETLIAYDPEIREERALDVSELGSFQKLFIVKTSDRRQREREAARKNWVGSLLMRFRPLILAMLGMTFFLNILSMIVPLYIMAIYDRVIPSQSTRVLAFLVGGIAIAFLVEAVLRLMRSRVIAYIGGRVEHLVATGTFRQILNLPPGLTESSPVGAQAARLKEFDSVRDLFTGPLVAIGLELPFVGLFIAVIAFIAGPVAWVPVIMMALYIVIGLMMLPSLKRSVAKSSRARAERHGFTVEMLANVRTIKQLGAESIWTNRYRDLSADSAFAHFRTAQISFMLQTFAQAIMMGAGITTIAWGVIRVIEANMTIGALIATMALVWRVLSPLQNLFLMLTRYEQVKLSIQQINQLLRLPTEAADEGEKPIFERQYRGGLAMNRVSFRYRPDAEPALLGASFSIEPGQVVAIIGGNGQGKSTVLNLLGGLYRPQAGQVQIDGIDIRQISPLEIRRSIAYVPQTPNFFHGTIAQNLRLGQPTASDEDLHEVCRKIGLLDAIHALPDGFETRLGDQKLEHLSMGFRQGLSIARGLLRGSPILLLDEAALALDEIGDKAFQNLLEELRGNTTVVMVSHRPSHIRLCDLAILVEQGQIANVAPPNELLDQMMKKPA